MVRYLYYMTQQILSYFQIGIAVLLGITILLQQKGQGLSGAFGGEGGFYRTKRGLEKILLITTVTLAVLFVGTGLFRIILSPAPSDSAASVLESPADTPPFELNTEPIVDGNAISIPEIEVKTEPVSPNKDQ